MNNFAFIVAINIAYFLLSSDSYTLKNKDAAISLVKLNSHTNADIINHPIATIKKVKDLQDGMKIRRLPRSDLEVSEVCLGSMNFGDQLNEQQSFEILNEAVNELGINFIDTAECYPAPFAESTSGLSEKIVGEWLKRSQTVKRSDLILSTKICGYSNEIKWLRKGSVGTRLSRDQIIEAVDAQLKRLNTDYIDLLQFNWPERYTPLYGSPDYLYHLERSDATPLIEQLQTIEYLIKEGKIRYFGLSNETPYGVGVITTLANALNLPRPITIQNNYNLLVRNDYENGLAEACSKIHGDLGLLAYSPLAGGALTGKYNSPEIDSKWRMRRSIGFMHRFISPLALEAIDNYLKVADDLSLPLGPLALAFVYSRPFVSSTIIGATSVEQLRDNVLSLNIPITKEMMSELDNVYRKFTDPTKGIFDIKDPNIDIIDPTTLPWGSKDQDVDPELDVLISQRLSRF